jgi:hypothetical protein
MAMPRTALRLRSVSENAAHIVGTRVAMIHGMLGEGDAALGPMDLWGKGSPGAPRLSGLQSRQSGAPGHGSYGMRRTFRIVML